MRPRLRQLLLAICVAVTGLASAQDRIELPDMGASADSLLSPAEERNYARALIAQLRAYGLLVEDPLITDYFVDMGYRLVANSDEPDAEYHFVVLAEPSINAFATPGGVIALHSGLVLNAEEASEVAGVVAHEIAHVTQRHLVRAFENARKVQIPIALAMLGLIVAGGGADVAQTALVGGQALAQQLQINFTRANEYEADRIGIGTMARAGYDPEGLASMFAKFALLSRSAGVSEIPEYMRTHPVNASRIAEARNRAAQWEVQDHADDPRFYLVQARLRATTEQYPRDAITWFEANRSSFPGAATDYGLAIAHRRAGDHAEAEKLLAGLLERDPGNLMYQIEQAQLDLDAGDKEAAFQRFRRLHHQFPGNEAIAVHYSRALVGQNRQDKAELAATILKHQIQEQPHNAALYSLYAQAADQAGDEVRAGEATAESYYLRGGIWEAIVQLEKLERRPDLDYYQRARITARLAELEEEFAELGRPIPPEPR